MSKNDYMPCDYSKYHKNWKSVIRPRILDRANNCCEKCGVPNYALIIRGIKGEMSVFQNMNGDYFDKVANTIYFKNRIISISYTTEKIDSGLENNKE